MASDLRSPRLISRFPTQISSGFANPSSSISTREAMLFIIASTIWPGMLLGERMVVKSKASIGVCVLVIETPHGIE